MIESINNLQQLSIAFDKCPKPIMNTTVDASTIPSTFKPSNFLEKLVIPMRSNALLMHFLIPSAFAFSPLSIDKNLHWGVPSNVNKTNEFLFNYSTVRTTILQNTVIASLFKSLASCQYNLQKFQLLVQ